MVAKVISGKNIRGLLNYNENKLRGGVAQCIVAHRFGCEPHALTFSNKLNRFTKIIAFNQKTKTNTIHISLNFDVSEILSNDKLSLIASDYMDRIGFGEQPYLVYRHTDAAHPHVHIITTNIQIDGKRIDIHNIGRNQSEKARKEIEVEYQLVRAESRKKSRELQPVNIEKAAYGKSETRRSISNIVRTVMRSYKYTSLRS
ncbi:MAG: relaxase/mobilization nuclease domain-containing protein [Cytophagales bacterium]|nr:relaxase/mobilization nuclease domain-containing protein [Cytophagales bacterium]